VKTKSVTVGSKQGPAGDGRDLEPHRRERARRGSAERTRGRKRSGGPVKPALRALQPKPSTLPCVASCSPNPRKFFLSLPPSLPPCLPVSSSPCLPSPPSPHLLPQPATLPLSLPPSLTFCNPFHWNIPARKEQTEFVLPARKGAFDGTFHEPVARHSYARYRIKTAVRPERLINIWLHRMHNSRLWYPAVLPQDRLCRKSAKFQSSSTILLCPFRDKKRRQQKGASPCRELAYHAGRGISITSTAQQKLNETQTHPTSHKL